MIRRPPRSTRTDTLFPYTTLFRAYKVRLEMPAFAAIRSAVERPNPSAKKTSRATRRIFLESACEACRVGLPVRPEACSLVFWVDVMPHLGHTLSAQIGRAHV